LRAHYERKSFRKATELILTTCFKSVNDDDLAHEMVKIQKETSMHILENKPNGRRKYFLFI